MFKITSIETKSLLKTKAEKHLFDSFLCQTYVAKLLGQIVFLLLLCKLNVFFLFLHQWPADKLSNDHVK